MKNKGVNKENNISKIFKRKKLKRKRANIFKIYYTAGQLHVSEIRLYPCKYSTDPKTQI